MPYHHTSRTTPSCRPLGMYVRRSPPRGCICNAAYRPHHAANSGLNMLSRLPVDPGPHPGRSHATVEAQTRRSNLRCHASVRLRRTAHREDLAKLRMKWPSGSGPGHLLSAPTSYQLIDLQVAAPVPASCSNLACIGTFLSTAAKTVDPASASEPTGSIETLSFVASTQTRRVKLAARGATSSPRPSLKLRATAHVRGRSLLAQQP